MTTGGKRTKTGSMRRSERAGRSGGLRATPVLLHLVAACLVVWLSGAGIALAAHGQPAGDDTLVWLDDYQAALTLAQETGRPLLVEFRCAP